MSLFHNQTFDEFDKDDDAILFLEDGSASVLIHRSCYAPDYKDQVRYVRLERGVDGTIVSIRYLDDREAATDDALPVIFLPSGHGRVFIPWA